MTRQLISRRRFLEGSFITCGTVVLPACGGGAEPEAEATSTETTSSALAAPAGSKTKVAPGPIKTPLSPTPVTGTLATRLKLTGTRSGTFPFSATVMPLRGAVPAGNDIESPDDLTLRCSTLSRHDDGSVAVAVVAGKVTFLQAGSVSMRLQAGPRSAAAALTPSAISAQVRQVSVAFGGSFGTANLSDFGNPERIWWANASTICARYRVAPPTPGNTALEAVIDVQTWSDRALVEVTIENAKMSSAQPVKPGVAGYTQATVSVNGSAVASGNGSGVPAETGHNAFRAWHCRTWVGAGDPKLVAHQDVVDLQMHPLLFKIDQACSVDLSGYASDTYVQWSFGRKPDAYMGGVGDVAAIGPLTQWDARWLQSGDAQAANAVDVQALMTLHWNINHRDSGTGRVPTHSQVEGKSINGNRSWPQQTNSNNALQWELMHHPAVGLAAFLVRPSPVFIEIAQKIAIWNAMWPTNWDNNTVQPTGVFRGGGCTTRGRAWALRSLAHAIFLTPDELAAGQPDPWKPAAKASLLANITYLDGYRTDAKSKLNITWEGDPALPQNIPYQTTAQSGPVFATRGWFSHYLITEVHKLSNARLLAGDGQSAAMQLADWLAGFPVRWVNEQTNGGWRYLPYTTAVGRNPTTIDMPDTWGAMTDYVHYDSPTSATGPWFFSTGDSATYATDYGSQDPQRPRYVDYFWAALVAAVERNVSGADRAWSTVTANVTNLATWRTGFGAEPRWGSVPRSLPSSTSLPVVGTPALGEWLEWTNSTNVRQITDVNPQTGVATGWLESRPNAVMTTWPGKMTWDAQRKQLIVVGAAAGGSSDVPAGLSTSALFFDLTTKQFSRQWNPFNRNSWHVYDSNATRPLGGFIYRTAPAPATLFKMDLATRVWTQADNVAAIGIGWGDAPALEVHPTLGAQGSILISGTNGRIGRVDRATGAVTLLASSLPGVAGLSPVISYHPGIDAVVFGAGESGNTLYKISNSGAITVLSSTLPTGVPSLSPDGARVLAPDPQGRPVAWMFDLQATRKVWRLDLNTGAWTDGGALPATFASTSAACVGTVPELGIHVWFDGNGRENSSTSGGRVWAYKPN